MPKRQPRTGAAAAAHHEHHPPTHDDDIVEAELEGEHWVTLEEASAAANISVSALRKWYSDGKIRSKLERTAKGRQRVVEMGEVHERAGAWHDAQAGRRSNVPAVFGADADAIAGFMSGFKDLTAYVAERSNTVDRLYEELAAEREAKARAEQQVRSMAEALAEAQRQLDAERAALELLTPAFAGSQRAN